MPQNVVQASIYFIHIRGLLPRLQNYNFLSAANCADSIYPFQWNVFESAISQPKLQLTQPTQNRYQIISL